MRSSKKLNGAQINYESLFQKNKLIKRETEENLAYPQNPNQKFENLEHSLLPKNPDFAEKNLSNSNFKKNKKHAEKFEFQNFENLAESSRLEKKNSDSREKIGKKSKNTRISKKINLDQFSYSKQNPLNSNSKNQKLGKIPKSNTEKEFEENLEFMQSEKMAENLATHQKSKIKEFNYPSQPNHPSDPKEPKKTLSNPESASLNQKDRKNHPEIYHPEELPQETEPQTRNPNNDKQNQLEVPFRSNQFYSQYNHHPLPANPKQSFNVYSSINNQPTAPKPANLQPSPATRKRETYQNILDKFDEIKNSIFNFQKPAKSLSTPLPPQNPSLPEQTSILQKNNSHQTQNSSNPEKNFPTHKIAKSKNSFARSNSSKKNSLRDYQAKPTPSPRIRQERRPRSQQLSSKKKNSASVKKPKKSASGSSLKKPHKSAQKKAWNPKRSFKRRNTPGKNIQSKFNSILSENKTKGYKARGLQSRSRVDSILRDHNIQNLMPAKPIAR